MLPHDWIVEEVDGGTLGVEDFWVCRRCGASGGMAYCLTQGLPPSIPTPFVNGRIGGPWDLPDDCEEAARLIKKYWDIRNVAIYGGSFDPVTWGHVVSTITFFLNNQFLDEVLVVPCNQQTGKDLIDFQHRYKMCQLAFQHLNKVTVSDVEFQLGGVSKTARLIQHLSDNNPDWKMRFVIGADLQDSWKTWKGADIIEKLAPPLVVPRSGYSKKVEDSPETFVNVSSTTVRRFLKMENRGTSFLERVLPGPVLSYIKEHKLYER